MKTAIADPKVFAALRVLRGHLGPGVLMGTKDSLDLRVWMDSRVTGAPAEYRLGGPLGVQVHPPTHTHTCVCVCVCVILSSFICS